MYRSIIRPIAFGVAITLAGAVAMASAQAGEDFTTVKNVAVDQLSAKEMAATIGANKPNPAGNHPGTKPCPGHNGRGNCGN